MSKHTQEDYENVCQALVDETKKSEYLKELLRKAIDHLDYCGYGDEWERECSESLQEELRQWQEGEGA